jgi:uncharacterized RmlC-like cupin family protein
VDEFRAMVALRQSSLDVMTSEFDELLESMQTKQAKTGIAKAFASSPKQLGAAAVTAVVTAEVTSTAKAKTKLRGKAEKTSARGLPKSARMTHSRRSTLVKR